MILILIILGWLASGALGMWLLVVHDDPRDLSLGECMFILLGPFLLMCIIWYYASDRIENWWDRLWRIKVYRRRRERENTTGSSDDADAE